MTEPRPPSYDAPRASPHGKPPISLPPLHPDHADRADRADRADDGTARVLAIAVVALSVLYAALAVLAEIPLDLAALDLADGRDPDDTTLDLASALAVGSLVVLLPLWVVTSLWLRAERERLGGSRSFTHGSAGTFFSWVVPFANLVWPLRVVREVHERAVEPRRRASLGSWWTLWLLTLLLGQVSGVLYDQQAVGDPTAGILATSALYATVLVLALVSWVAVVLRTSRV